MRTILMIALLCIPVTSIAEVKAIVVPVTLTYQGKSANATLAVDTGATTTTISTQLASRLGIPADCRHGGLAQMADGRAVSYQTAIMTVVASTMAREDLDVNIMEYAGDRGVDGMLGLNFLSGMTMTFDWKHRRIYWSE